MFFPPVSSCVGGRRDYTSRDCTKVTNGPCEHFLRGVNHLMNIFTHGLSSFKHLFSTDKVQKPPGIAVFILKKERQKRCHVKLLFALIIGTTLYTSLKISPTLFHVVVIYCSGNLHHRIYCWINLGKEIASTGSFIAGIKTSNLNVVCAYKCCYSIVTAT